MNRMIYRFIFILAILVSNFTNAQNFFKEQIPRKNSFSIGIGPSLAYMDNGGQYRSGRFEVKAAASGSFYHKINPRIDFRATIGIQQIQSGGEPTPDLLAAWAANSSAFTAKGSLYFVDIMPSFSLIPASHYFSRGQFNLYGGVGLGFLQSITEQTKSFDPNEIPTKFNLNSLYIPTRTGISFRLGPYSDISGELTYFWTFSDMLDGNSSTNSYHDQMLQGMLVYRKYLLPKSIQQ